MQKKQKQDLPPTTDSEAVHGYSEQSKLIDNILDSTIITADMQFEQTDLLNQDNYANYWKIGQFLAKSKTIPSTFKGDAYSCATALMYSKTMRRPVMWLMNNMIFVHGKFSFEGAAVHDLLDSSGMFKSRMKLKIDRGDEEDYKNLKVTVSNTFVGDDEPVVASWTWQQACNLGWTEKKDMTFWHDMALDMCFNNAFKRFCKRYCPSLLGGVPINDGSSDGNSNKPEEKAPLFPEKKQPINTSGHESNQSVKTVDKPVVPEKEKTQKAIFENPEKLAEIVTENRDTFPNAENLKVAENETLKPDKTGTVRNIDTENNLELPKAVSEALGTIIKTLHASQIKTERFELYISSEMPAMLDKGATLNNINTKNLLALSKDLVSCISQYRAWEKEKATSKK